MLFASSGVLSTRIMCGLKNDLRIGLIFGLRFSSVGKVQKWLVYTCHRIKMEAQTNSQAIFQTKNFPCEKTNAESIRHDGIPGRPSGSWTSPPRGRTPWTLSLRGHPARSADPGSPSAGPPSPMYGEKQVRCNFCSMYRVIHPACHEV